MTCRQLHYFSQENFIETVLRCYHMVYSCFPERILEFINYSIRLYGP